MDNPCKEVPVPKHRMLRLSQLTTMTRESWPEYPTFDAAVHFKWPGPAAYMFPNVTPALSPDGATTPMQLLQALCAKNYLEAGAYVVLVTEADLTPPPEAA